MGGPQVKEVMPSEDSSHGRVDSLSLSGTLLLTPLPDLSSTHSPPHSSSTRWPNIQGPLDHGLSTSKTLSLNKLPSFISSFSWVFVAMTKR